MNVGPNDARYQTPQDLAGPRFEAMMSSKEAALEYLSAPDYSLRLAAILICQSTWNCGPDVQLVGACVAVAGSDADDSTRSLAVGALGTALSSTKQPKVSQFLANLATKPTTPNEVRIEAYWALRDIQFGSNDVDWFKRLIYLAKSALRQYPGRFREETVRRNLLYGGHRPDGVSDSAEQAEWDSAEQIDWNFVNQFTDGEN